MTAERPWAKLSQGGLMAMVFLGGLMAMVFLQETCTKILHINMSCEKREK